MFRSKHYIHGVKLNDNFKQSKRYKKYLKSICFSPCDITKIEHLLDKEHEEINSLNYYENDKILIEIPSTMIQLNNNLNVNFNFKENEKNCLKMFNHQQMLPICFLKSLKTCPNPLKQYEQNEENVLL